MNHIHKLLSFLGNISLAVLIIGLTALPATSVGLLHVVNKSDSKGTVLSTQDIRIKIDPAEIKSGRYFYNESTGKIEKKMLNSSQKQLIEVMQKVSESTETIEETSDY